MSNSGNASYHFFFSNLANPLRIDIVLSLRDKEKSVTKLYKELGVEQSKLSHALASLRCCNIVESKKQGKERIYFLNKKTIMPILNLIDKHSTNFCKTPCSKCEKASHKLA
ncbi:MAG: metalloregulator ArsR/SmtB family transcription factor [Nanoarchaeota archaeon]